MDAPIPVEIRFFSILIIVGIVIWQLVIRWRKIISKPDPWDSEIETAVQQPDAVVVCHRCFTPQPDNAWFCEHCNSAVGPYNNWMPYIDVFSEGEVFRNGTTDKLRLNALTVSGYLLFSMGAYVFFAPVYWFFFFKHIKQLRAAQPEENISDGGNAS